MKNFSTALLFVFTSCFQVSAQDTSVIYKNQVFHLSEVVVRNDFNVGTFIDYVRNDTTFYKAFRNLHLLGFSSFNDIKIVDKKGKVKASLFSKTRQIYQGSCRTMQTSEQTITGDFLDKQGNFNYTTAELYAGLFFTKEKVCGETNIVAGRGFSTKGKSGIEKHKEQLKQLFFNPGTKVSGIPFIGKKVALFDNDVRKLYNFDIDVKEYEGKTCYVFKIIPRVDLTSSEKDDMVIDEMTTWFDAANLDIVGRNYTLSYNAGVYDFNVSMEVQLGKVRGLLVPTLLRYNGYWDVVFKKKEQALFTATLFDFQ